MRSRSWFWIAAAIATLGGGTARASESPADPAHPVQTVEHVDLDRYIGLWHQIALIPNRFQDQCAGGTTATYTRRDDGKITVLNRCRTAEGKMDEAEGLAKIENDVTNAELKVSFVSFLGWRPFWGDYWVIGLDEDYDWAAVGTPRSQVRLDPGPYAHAGRRRAGPRVCDLRAERLRPRRLRDEPALTLPRPASILPPP